MSGAVALTVGHASELPERFGVSDLWVLPTYPRVSDSGGLGGETENWHV